MNINNKYEFIKLMNKNCYAFIFARGGSKGLPGKNKIKLNGLPLIAHSIQTAQNSASISKVFLSTDCEELAMIGKQYGAEVPFIRPSKLARDDSPEWLSWQHAVNAVEGLYGEFDTFVSLPATSPLRSVKDVEACITMLTEETDIVVTCTPAARNPYFNMLKKIDENQFKIAFTPKNPFTRRQDAPDFYDMTTVAYVTRPSFIKEKTGIFDGNMNAHIVPIERAVDIDTEEDFDLAQYYASKKGP